MPITTLRRRAACSALLLSVLLASCSGNDVRDSDASNDGVASLGTEPRSRPSSPAADEGRPRERIDMTDDERERMNLPYRECMMGISTNPGQKPSDEDVNASDGLCSPLEPLPAWERDPANPEATQFARDVVTCLKRNGVRYVEVVVGDDGLASPSFGGPQNDERSISRGLELSPQCEREAAEQ